MILFIIIFACFDLKAVLGQCTGTTTVGLDNTSSKKSSDYDGTGTNSILADANKYQFGCCGFVSSWEVFARNGVTTPIDVKVQVWQDTGTTTWNLRGENVISITNDNAENIVTIASGSRIRVQQSDHIGFYEHAGSVITYGGGSNYFARTIGTSLTTFDETTASSSGNNRDHAIHATVVASSAPSFTNLDDTVNIDNTEAGGNTIFNLTVTDTDAEDLSGSLTVAGTSHTGSAATFFEIQLLTSSTFAVKIQNGVTLTPGNHATTYTVTDGCGLTGTGVLTVSISNTPPVITSIQTANNITISEDSSTEMLQHTLVVVDTDPTTCSLTTTGVPFDIYKGAGASNDGIYLKNGASLNYYDRSAYVLEFGCSDGYTTTSGTFTVYLKENKRPTIVGLPISHDVSEDTDLETTLHTFTITDPENDDVFCNVSSTVPALTTIIFIKPTANKNEYDIILKSKPNLVYDTLKAYRLNIWCTDGRRSDTSIYFMYVTRNQPPMFVNLQNTTIMSSKTSYIGLIVFDVEYTDKENDQVNYTMTCTSPADTTAISPLKIYDSGQIVLQRDISRETVVGYDCYVTITDGKSTTGPRSLTIHVIDLNNIPIIMNLPLLSALVVPENSNLDLSIYQVSIQDKDETDTHTYSMTSDPGDGMSYFAINSSSGLFTTSTNTINFEGVMTSTSIVFTITVSDSEDSSSQNLSISIINVNEAPVFTKKAYVLSVDEGIAGTILTDPGYLYSDDDVGDNHTFAMTCANNVGYFSINSATGRISLATDVDYDVTGFAASYTCVVAISDGELTDTATVTINVNNINDNSPTFNDTFYTFTVSLSQAANTDFGLVAATDGDAGTFGQFTYSLDQSATGADVFDIRTSGALYLKSTLGSFGYTYGQSIMFKAVATDTGGLQGTTSIYVIIQQTTTVASTTTPEPYVTFWEHPPNSAWVICAGILALIICFLPCYIIYKYPGRCTYKGRPKPLSEKPASNHQDDSPTKAGNYNAKWKPWYWFQIKK